VLAVITVCALLASQAAAASAAPELTLLDKSPAEVKISAGKDTETVQVTVLNIGGEAIYPTVSFEASDSKSIAATLVGLEKVEPRQAVQLAVKLAGLRDLPDTVKGQIVIDGGSKPLAQSVTITPAMKPLLNWPRDLIIAALAVATLLVGAVALCLLEMKDARGSRLLWGSAPGPKWSIESWASHLTAVGALLGTVTAEVLPEAPEQIDKKSLVALSLLFAGLAAVAPFVFQALRRPDAKAGEEDEGNWGFTWGMLIACWLTLGAVLGELATLGLICWEATNGGIGGYALEGALGILVLLAGYYVVTTAYSLGSVDWKEITESAKLAAEPTHIAARAKVAKRSSRAARHLDIGAEAQGFRMTLRLP
jgi:hypothetical protein